MAFLPHFCATLSRLALAALLFTAGTSFIRAEWRIGDPLPTLESKDFNGASLPETKGKVVLIDFWASWCAPCKASFPAYGRLHQELAEKGVVILAIGVDQEPAAYTAFVRKQKPPFAVVHDRQQTWVNRAHVPTMPTAYLFGRDGQLRFIHRGFHGKESEEALSRQLTALLEEKAP